MSQACDQALLFMMSNYVMMNSCPQCRSKNTATILYGYMPITKELEVELKQKRVVLGGCCVSDDDPKWQCNDCPNIW